MAQWRSVHENLTSDSQTRVKNSRVQTSGPSVLRVQGSESREAGSLGLADQILPRELLSCHTVACYSRVDTRVEDGSGPERDPSQGNKTEKTKTPDSP